MLNSVVKISMMSAKYFEYYTIILRGAVFSWTHCIYRYTFTGNDNTHGESPGGQRRFASLNGQLTKKGSD